MRKSVKFYRKEEPEEYLPKLVPVLGELGIQWPEVLGSIQPLLKEKGIEMFYEEPDTSEIYYILFTDEKTEKGTTELTTAE